MRPKSKYDKYFDSEDGGRTGICKICKETYSWNGTTTGLAKHLYGIHLIKVGKNGAANHGKLNKNRKAEKTKQRTEEDKETDDEEAQRVVEDLFLNEDRDQSGDSQRGISPTLYDNDDAVPQYQPRSRKHQVSSGSSRMPTPRRYASSPNRSARQQMGGSDDVEEEWLPHAKKANTCRKRGQNRDHSSYENHGNEFSRRRRRNRGQDEPGPSYYRERSPLFDDYNEYDNDTTYRRSHRFREDSYSPPRPRSTQQPSPHHSVAQPEMNEDACRKENKEVLKLVLDEQMAVSIFSRSGLNSFINGKIPEYKTPTEKVLLDEALPDIHRDIKFQIKNELTSANKISVSIHVQPSAIDPEQKVVAIHAFYTNPAFTPCRILLYYSVTDAKHVGGKVSIGLNKLNDETNSKERIEKIHFFTENLSPVDDSFERVTNHGTLNEASRLPCLDHLLNDTYRAFTKKLPNQYKDVVLNQKKLYRQNLIAVKDKELSSLIKTLLDTEEDCWQQHRKHVAASLSDKKNTLSDDEQRLTVLMGTLYEEIEKSMNSFRYGNHLAVSSTIPIFRSLIIKIEALKEVNIRHSQWLHHILPKIKKIYILCCKNNTLRSATYLDSRFKNIYFTDEFRVGKKHFERDVKPELTNPKDGPNQNEKAALPGSELAKLDHQKTTSQLEREMAFYENLPPHPENPTPSEFWKTQEINLPILSNLAKDYSHLPAFATGAEELFAAGRAMLPFTRENKSLHQKLVFCFGNKHLIKNE